MLWGADMPGARVERGLGLPAVLPWNKSHSVTSWHLVSAWFPMEWAPWGRKLRVLLPTAFPSYRAGLGMDWEWVEKGRAKMCGLLQRAGYILAKKGENNNRNQTAQWKNVQKALLDVFPKKIYKWSISTWKDAQNYWSLGKCKSKSQSMRYHFTPMRMIIIKKEKHRK